MDIQQIKDELPMVMGKYNGELYWCRVSGRKNKFATVSPYQPIRQIRTIIGPLFHVSWQAIERSINNDNQPIILS